jgi:hypothetical protein
MRKVLRIDVPDRAFTREENDRLIAGHGQDQKGQSYTHTILFSKSKDKEDKVEVRTMRRENNRKREQRSQAIRKGNLFGP